MAGIASEEARVGRLTEGVSSRQRCQSAEALAEWRSSDQVENGTPSTSPLYWDTDDDNDGGPKPSELHGKYTWKIENFSQINKRELHSNTFEVGSYKWYILIYPQGCDVCNHLSLFLCVANHDKLLPGWSHFAQFTIAVVNKDPKKSKYSDTLHRFWKKEHDWGWKKFMELSKVSDGFLDTADTLIIKAQVQVIREKSDRPFRCLDCLYRRELIRVYLTNVEQTCWRFVEERRGKLVRLMDDNDTWSSFRSFWSGMDRNTRHCMSREKADSVLKVVVKHFFIEKEVTSTLVMDSLYSGLKALEGQTKSKARAKLLEVEEIPAPLVSVEKDMFVLVDDVLMLIARAAMEPWPPKDEKGPQNRTKDGNLGEDFNKDSIEQDERRLTELGRRTMEIFILAHIFNQKIEVSYQEAVALKRQEELIREEELAASLAESDQKGKNGATEKEKKLKKKQTKQRRNNRKGKEKGREDRSDIIVLEKLREENPSNELKGSVTEEELAAEKPDILEDVSDSVDGTAEVLQPDLEDRDTSPVNWDTDASDAHPPTGACSSEVGILSSGNAEKNPSVMDDSSSTCSTDSVPSVVMNGPSKLTLNKQCERSSSREKSDQGKLTCEGSWTSEMDSQCYRTAANSDDLVDGIRNSKANHLDSEAGVCALPKRMTHPEQHVVKKVEEVFSLQTKSRAKGPIHGGPVKEKIVVPSAPRGSPPKNLPATTRLKVELKVPANVDSFHIRRVSPRHSHHPHKTEAPVTSLPSSNTSKPEMQTASVSKLPERSVVQHGAVTLKASSAPQAPVPRPVASVVSKVQAAPTPAHSVSASGRGGPDTSPSSHSYAPQSYRNAVVGSSLISNSSTSAQGNSGSSEVGSAQAPTGLPASVSAPMVLSPGSDRVEPTSVHSSFLYGLVNRNALQNGTPWMNGSEMDENRGVLPDPSVINGYQNLDFYRPMNNGYPEQVSVQAPASSSGRQSQVVVTDEFPHLDIINDLLDDEHSAGMAAGAGRRPQSFGGGSQFLTRQFSLTHDPGVSSELGSSTTSGPSGFDRTKSYLDRGFRRSYSQFDNLSKFLPQASPYTHSNGLIDGLMPGQWQIAGPDLLVSMMNADSQTSPYLNSDYLNLACGANAYPFFRPSNGL